MPRIALPGFEAHYEQAGDGPQAVVLVHGNFASSRWWQDLLDTPPPGLCLYAPDLRGCGRSQQPGEGYEMAQLVRDLEAFATALELPRFHLVGHSLGGSVALAFALDHPERVASLLLVTPGPADGLAQTRDGMLVHLLGTERIAHWLPDLAQHRWVLSHVLPHVAPGIGEPLQFARITEDALATDPRAVSGYLMALAEWNALPRLPAYPGRAVVLIGERDPLVPPASLAATIEALPHVVSVLWTGVGHAPQLERPEDFRRLLLATIDAREPEPLQPVALHAAAGGWFHDLARRLGLGGH